MGSAAASLLVAETLLVGWVDDDADVDGRRARKSCALRLRFSLRRTSTVSRAAIRPSLRSSSPRASSSWSNRSRAAPNLHAVAVFVGGYGLWTLTEYWIHRSVFHLEPKSRLGGRLHWIFHGVHHDHPNDPRRLVMPPIVTGPAGRCVRCPVRRCSRYGNRRDCGSRFHLRVSAVRHAPLRAAPRATAKPRRAPTARAPHAPPLPGRRALLRSQRPLVGQHLRYRGSAQHLEGARPSLAPWEPELQARLARELISTIRWLNRAIAEHDQQLGQRAAEVAPRGSAGAVALLRPPARYSLRSAFSSASTARPSSHATVTSHPWKRKRRQQLLSGALLPQAHPRPRPLPDPGNERGLDPWSITRARHLHAAGEKQQRSSGLH